MHVVHDLLANVDRGPISVEGPLHDLDGSLHAGAERAGPGQQDRARTGRAGPPAQGGRGPAEGPIGRQATGKPRLRAAERELVPGGVHHDAHDGERSPRADGGPREGRRFHVDGDRTVTGHPGSLTVPNDVVGAHNGADADPCQPEPSDGCGERRAGARERLAVLGLNLGRHHHVAGGELIGERAAEPGHGHRSGKRSKGGTGGLVGPVRPHPGAGHAGAGNGTNGGADRCRLDGERGEDQQPRAFVAIPASHRSTPPPRPPPTNRPRAWTGKINRYR